MKNLIFILLLTWCSQALIAQPIEVYFAKGEVTIIKEGSVVKAEKGSQLKPNETLELKQDNMIVLYQDTKAVVLRGPGSYSYSKISAQFEDTKKSISDRYIGYLWQKAHEDDKSGEDEGSGNLAVTGMVSRGANGISSPADSVVVLVDKFPIQLDQVMVPGYVFLYDRKKPIGKFTCDSAVFYLNFGGDLNKGKWYGLAAASNDNAPFNSIQYFRWASEKELFDFQAKFSEFLAEIEEYPEEMKAELVQAYLTMNNYLYANE